MILYSINLNHCGAGHTCTSFIPSPTDGHNVEMPITIYMYNHTYVTLPVIKPFFKAVIKPVIKKKVILLVSEFCLHLGPYFCEP